MGPKEKGSPRGVAGGRPHQHLGRDSRVGPRGDRPPVPCRANGHRPRGVPWTLRGPLAPSPGLLRGRSLHSPPGPRRAHPGSAGCLIVLRRRPCSAAAAAPASAQAPAAVLAPARPRAPAAPPRRRTRPAPAAAVANQRAGGRSRPRARPGQSSPYLRGEERPRKWAGDWSGLLKGPPRAGRGERGGSKVTWKSRGGRVKNLYSLLTWLQRFPSSLYLLISSSCSLATTGEGTWSCQRKKLRRRESEVCFWANSPKFGF